MPDHAASGPSSPPPPEIPDKLYFRIGEVSHLAGVKPYVLRYWEKEFPQIAPKKSGTGQRLYRRKEVELVLEIRNLLKEKRFTIEGARRHLDAAEPLRKRRKPALGAPPPSLSHVQGELFAVAVVWRQIREELLDILQILK